MNNRDYTDKKDVDAVMAANRTQIQQAILNRFLADKQDSTVAEIAKMCDRGEGWVRHNMIGQPDGFTKVAGIMQVRQHRGGPPGWRRSATFGPHRGFLADLINSK